MKPVIGILFGPRTARALPHGQTGTESIHLYQKAAKKLHIHLFYTSLPQINLKRRKAKGWLYQNSRTKAKNIPLPSVFHNRAMPFRSKDQRKLKALAKYATVFNRKTRYSKLRIHRLLNKNASVKPHLPDTSPLNRKTLATMMYKYDTLFVKPKSGSLGRGIYALSRKRGQMWMLQISRRKQKVAADDMYHVLKSKVRTERYLVQEGIPLAKFKGRPFDLRVSVQKDGSGRWQITGMVGKVAAKGKRVTNIGRGGRAERTAKLFRSLGLNTNTASASVRKFSLRTAKHLASHLPGLADLGLDIGITSSGKPYFIEMNGKDQRYSFREAGMHETWYRTYQTPLAYAKYIAVRKSRRNRLS